MAPAVKGKLKIKGAWRKRKLQNMQKMLEEVERLEGLAMHVSSRMHRSVGDCAEDHRSEARFRSFAYNIESSIGEMLDFLAELRCS